MVTPASTPTARKLMWSLLLEGWTEREAGNLVAVLHGLKPSPAGWSVREIEHLRWVRALHRSGRVLS
jgi:hypothetical protein